MKPQCDVLHPVKIPTMLLTAGAKGSIFILGEVSQEITFCSFKKKYK